LETADYARVQRTSCIKLESPVHEPGFFFFERTLRVPPSMRRKLWGDIIDPNDALADFDPRYISDGQLGAP
jgi:hypothetical protein